MSPELKNGPVSPAEAAELMVQQIPDQVFNTFNTLIAESGRKGYARLLQKDIVTLLLEQGLDRDEIFERHWLDIEDAYREVGWQVRYDKPIYYGGENFEPYFEFRANGNER